jgi:rhamnose transport system ATP-binding protein
VRSISKRFGGVQALTDVGFAMRPGEVMALIGENGAGKSTLVKILTGVHRPDAGEIIVGGTPHAFSNAREAAAAGITAIHQEAVLFDDLTVAENIMISHPPRFWGGGPIDWSRLRRQASAHLADIGASIDPSAQLGTIGIAERHLVSIANALAFDAQILIFDEPTAALSLKEIDVLYDIVRKLRDAGRSIIFISHKFDEIFAIADRYTVLRDGAFIATGAIAETSRDALVRMMVGRPMTHVYPKFAVPIGDVALEIQGYSHPTEFRDISFNVRRGEIVGFYGLVGAGRTEVMEAVFGLTKTSAGRVSINGRSASISRPADAVRQGIAYIPEDRGRNGGILSMTIGANISLAVLGRLGGGPFLSARAETTLARRFMDLLSIKAAGTDQRLDQLSGGNQQKVVISKWLATEPSIIILDEPTKGIDIGSKIAVHEFIGTLVSRGVAVILVSSELDEVLGLADRVVVMHRGRIAAELDKANASRELVVRYASGDA